jgi:hypothetical protein
MQLLCWQDHAFAHGSVTVDAEYLKDFATVGSALLAGMAAATVQVGLHGAAVAYFEMAHVWTDGDDFNTQLMSKDARIFDEGHFAHKGADVSAADTDGADGDEGFTWLRCSRFSQLDEI